MSDLTPATLAWLAELNATIRADERAKVAEEVATAIERDAQSYIGDDFLTGMDFAAAIARQHAVRTPGEAVEPRTGSPTCPTTPEPAQATTAGFGTPDTSSTHDDRQEQRP